MFYGAVTVEESFYKLDLKFIFMWKNQRALKGKVKITKNKNIPFHQTFTWAYKEIF